jgi:hypothetical protein
MLPGISIGRYGPQFLDDIATIALNFRSKGGLPLLTRRLIIADFDNA